MPKRVSDPTELLPTEIFLAFNNDVNHVICGFRSIEDVTNFIQAFTEPEYEALPTINPLHKPFPYFNSAEAAVEHFLRRKRL